MPTVTYKKPNPLEGGLSGLEGAFAGKERGMQFNEDVRQYEQTHAEDKRQFNEDIGLRIRQLEVLQEQNQLTRDQEVRLEDMREKHAEYLKGAELGSQEYQTSMREQAETARNKVRASVDYTRIREQKKTEEERLGLQRQQLHSDPMQRLSAVESVVSRFDGGYDGFLKAPPQEQQMAVESLAAERTGQERWAGSPNVNPLSERERQQAMEDARRDLYGYKELRSTVSDRAIEFETARAQAKYDIESGAGAGTDMIRQTYLSEVTQRESFASPETGLYPLDPINGPVAIGQGNFQDVLVPVDLMISAAVEVGQGIRGRGGDELQYYDEWKNRWADIEKQFQGNFRGDKQTYQRFLNRARAGLTQAIYGNNPNVGYVDPDTYIMWAQSGMDMDSIDEVIKSQVGGATQLLQLKGEIAQEEAAKKQLEQQSR